MFIFNINQTKNFLILLKFFSILALKMILNLIRYYQINKFQFLLMILILMIMLLILKIVKNKHVKELVV
jgi:hypothetical protein